MELLHIGLLLLGVLFCAFGIAYLQHRSERNGDHIVSRKIQKDVNRVLVKQGYMDADVAKFLADHSRYRSVIYKANKWGHEEFMRRLAANFKSVTILVYKAEVYGDSPILPDSYEEVYEVINEENVKFFLKINKEEVEAYRGRDDEETPVYLGDYDWARDLSEERRLQVIRMVTTVIPIEVCDDNCSIEYSTVLNTCLTASKLTYIHEPERHVENELNTYHMVNTMVGPRFKSYRETPQKISPTKLNTSYNAVSLEYNGEQYQVPMAELVPVLRQQLMDGGNITISGPTGTGKSTLIDDLLLDMHVTVVRLNSEVVKLLHSAEAKDQLVDFCSHRELVVFVYDEAQEVASSHHDTLKLMALMDGDLKKLLPKVAVILALNVRKEDVLPDLVRPGRGGIVMELQALEPNKARNLGTLLASEGKTVDTVKLESVIQQKGAATLAETYGAVIPENILPIVQKKLQRFKVVAAVPPPPVIKVSKK